jgi:hypothetical protein
MHSKVQRFTVQYTKSTRQSYLVLLQHPELLLELLDVGEGQLLTATCVFMTFKMPVITRGFYSPLTIWAGVLCPGALYPDADVQALEVHSDLVLDIVHLKRIYCNALQCTGGHN